MHTDNNFSPDKEVNNNDIKYKHLRSLDTAKLQTLLQQESFLSPEDKLDVDLIQHIIAILDEREPVSEEPDVELSLKVFKEEIIPELEKEIAETDANSITSLPAAPKRNRFRRRFATILIAAIVAILLGGTLVASAFGYDIWKYVISWGRDTFQMGYEAQVTSGPSVTPSPQSGFNTVKTGEHLNLDEAIEAINGDILTPKWIPDGFEYDSAVVAKNSNIESLVAVYKAGDSIIIFSAGIQLNKATAYSYEINETGGEAVTIAGKTCYIVTNINQTGVIWADKDIVYNIYSNIEKDSLVRMVESIYKGEV